jgi:uncharacterized protein
MSSFLDQIPALKDAEIVPVVTLLTVTSTYLLVHCAASQQRFETWLKKSGQRDPEAAQELSVYLQRLVGAFLLGVIPLVVIIYFLGGCPLALGFQPPKNLTGAVLFVTILAAIIVPFIFLNSKNPEHLKHYPEIRTKLWTKKKWLANAGTWIVYLVAYEFFIRGFLLLTLVEHYGPWPGLFMMTSFYVAIHLPKGPTEAIVCLPMGLAFGLSAVLLESVFPAVCLHAIISISNATFTLRNHPDMSLS